MNLQRLVSKLLADNGLPTDRVEGYLPLFERATQVEMKKGEVLCQEGDAPDGMHLLVEGTLKVELGREREVIAILSAPRLIGHMGLVDGEARSATVRAAEDTVVLHLGQDDCTSLIGSASLQGARFRELILAAMFCTLHASSKHLRELLSTLGEGVPVRR